MSEQLPVALVALVALAGLGYIGRRNLMAFKGRYGHPRACALVDRT